MTCYDQLCLCKRIEIQSVPYRVMMLLITLFASLPSLYPFEATSYRYFDSNYYNRLHQELQRESTALGIQFESKVIPWYQIYNMPPSEGKDKLLKIAEELKMEQFYSYYVNKRLEDYRLSLISALNHDEPYNGKINGMHVIDLLELAKRTTTMEIKAIVAEINLKYKKSIETAIVEGKLHTISRRLSTFITISKEDLSTSQLKILDKFDKQPTLENYKQIKSNFGDKITMELIRIEKELDDLVRIHSNRYKEFNLRAIPTAKVVKPFVVEGNAPVVDNHIVPVQHTLPIQHTLPVEQVQHKLPIQHTLQVPQVQHPLPIQHTLPTQQATHVFSKHPLPVQQVQQLQPVQQVTRMVNEHKFRISNSRIAIGVAATAVIGASLYKLHQRKQNKRVQAVLL